MAFTIRPRSGTPTQWSEADPILAEREIGIEVPESGSGSGPVSMKMGDGVRAWSRLPYALRFLTSDLTIHVSTTGSDDLNDGSVGKPFKTIQAAVDNCPKYLNGHTVTIQVDTAGSYEGATFENFSGGWILFAANAAITVTSKILIMGCKVRIGGELITVKSSDYGISVAYNAEVSILNNMVFDSCANALYVQYGSVVTMPYTVTITVNKSASAVTATAGGRIHFSKLTGSGNTSGLTAAMGAVISFVTNGINATTPTATSDGGRILSGVQTAVGKY